MNRRGKRGDKCIAGRNLLPGIQSIYQTIRFEIWSGSNFKKQSNTMFRVPLLSAENASHVHNEEPQRSQHDPGWRERDQDPNTRQSPYQKGPTELVLCQGPLCVEAPEKGPGVHNCGT